MFGSSRSRGIMGKAYSTNISLLRSKERKFAVSRCPVLD
jgi:hypothetical protein